MLRLMPQKSLALEVAVVVVAVTAGALLAAPVDDAARAPEAVRQDACRLARWAVERNLAGKPHGTLPFTPSGMLARPGPCFVTISLDGGRKGCTGNFEPQGRHLAENITRTAVRALNLDPRARRLTPMQMDDARFQVTIPGQRKAVASPAGYPPANYGLVIEGAGRSAVLLPGEARTTEWQVGEARRQAGIPPNARVSIFVFRAVTFSEKKAP